MSTQSPGPVVVGTDGSAHADTAVSLAAWEAHHRGRPLWIIHGYLVAVPYTSMGFAAYDVETAYPMKAARAALAKAAARVREIYPDLTVETALVAGSPAGVLVDRSRDAALVVVGSRGLGGFAGLLAGSVTTQLVAHGHAPVIVVRPLEAGGPDAVGAPAARPVVVGVDGTPESAAALAFGFEEADARGVALVALYAWWILPSSNLGPINSRHYEPEEAAEEARRMLSEAVAGWSEKYPDVPVELRPVHDMNSARALLDAAEDAGLIVVSRHSGHTIARLVLGSIGDALVRFAPCQVAVVPETTR